MKYCIVTYGCQMNHSDSERVTTVLEGLGYKPTSGINEADLIVVNMCSVRQSAVDRVFGILNQISPATAGSRQRRENLKNQNCKVKCKVILTGCILSKDRKKLEERVNFILDIKDLPNWSVRIKKIRRASLKLKNYLKTKPKYKSGFSALIPISNGCNNFCSYCVVPYVRGKEICRDYREILKEVENAVKNGLNPVRGTTPNGAREIWLLGQNVNSYKSGTINFPKLLKMVNDIPGNFWIRFTSPHPNDFSNELIEAMAKCEKVTPYLNLPVQSGDNKILKKMNRNYTAQDYKKLVKKIRKAIPEIALSTDVIVGFPGETKKQFENTAKLFRELKFDMAYISKYSPRPQTSAAKLKDTVPHQEKERRWKILTEILKKTALQNNKKFIGRTMEVLVNNTKKHESEHKNTQNIRVDSYSNSCKFVCSGKTLNYKTLKFRGSKNLIGQFVKVKITDALPWGLKGTLL